MIYNKERNGLIIKVASSVPDVLKLDEYVNTVYKHAVDKDAKPHQWFSERYMKESIY